jgi:hypothetical protein
MDYTALQLEVYCPQVIVRARRSELLVLGREAEVEHLQP